MKFIEEAAQDFCWGDDTDHFPPYAREFGMKAFKAGVKFAQQWIDVNDELPDENEIVLTKEWTQSEPMWGVCARIGNDWYNFAGKVEYIPTHWRKIDLFV